MGRENKEKIFNLEPLKYAIVNKQILYYNIYNKMMMDIILILLFILKSLHSQIPLSSGIKADKE